jgi:predicted metal-dependent peptidase
MGKKKEKADNRKTKKQKNFDAGLDMVHKHRIFSSLMKHIRIISKDYGSGYALAHRDGVIHCYTGADLEAREWARVIAHCLLHLGMGHFDAMRFGLIGPDTRIWNCACDLIVERFLEDIKFGVRPPPDWKTPEYLPLLPEFPKDELRLYERLLQNGLEGCVGFGTAGLDKEDMIVSDDTNGMTYHVSVDWTKVFAEGLEQAVRDAVDEAGGIGSGQDANSNKTPSKAEKAKAWFMSSYPLLGALASSFKIVEDPLLCGRMGIHIAAISTGLQELYINPAANLGDLECRFVIAHELLHAGLRHDVRHEWRDPCFWNVACDFVINQWLIEMEVGEPPQGILLDKQFKGLSAEAVYDQIATDIGKFRKLATLRGVGIGDILSKDELAEPTDRALHSDLDDFYRRCLGQGLERYDEQSRGYLPAGLIEEIRALFQPPIPWDVELARWFDEHFTPLEKNRSYARLSRRQSSTPDIPRPAWITTKAALDGRTFGVILDTSGSMSRSLLANALGAIASYAAARDVPAVRVVFCDAASYDQGYLRPDDIAGAVKVKGRGGTILQRGIDMLKNADDFPENAPILIITDGYCEDRLILYGHEHAYLIPPGNTLPFIPQGKVFRMKESTTSP